MDNVHGTWDPKFSQLPQLLQNFINDGTELGASLCVLIDSKAVVDIWGGYADPDHKQPWERDTLATVFSTTKTVSALAALLLVERGTLDVNERVATYWPEFAANGKQDILVRHLLAHTSGVSGWDDAMTMASVCDVPSATAKLATQAPWWEPGTASGYHAMTYGHLIGEVVLRTTGKSLGVFVAEELAGPLDADFHIGTLPEAEWGRISNVVPPPPMQDPGLLDLTPGTVAARSIANPLSDIPFVWTPAWRRAEVGGASGHGNARGVARLLDVVTTGGEIGGKRLLSQETVDLIFQEQAKGEDLVISIPMRYGIGFGLTGDGDMFVDQWFPRGKVCFWGGYGGSMVLMDVGRGITIGYVMNRMTNTGLSNEAFKTYLKAIYAALGIEIGTAAA